MEILKSLEMYRNAYGGDVINGDLTQLVLDYRGFKIHFDIMPITTALNASQYTTRLRVLMQSESQLKFHVKSKGIKLLNALKSNIVEVDHEVFNQHYKCLGNDEKMIQEIFQNDLLHTISTYKSMQVHLIKEHELGINCIDGEKCLLLTLPEAVLKTENIKKIIGLFERILDQLITYDHVSHHEIKSKLL